MTGEPLVRKTNILVYGITDEQFLLVSENLPNNDICIVDCSDCFTDIIATSYTLPIPFAYHINDPEYKIIFE